MFMLLMMNVDGWMHAWSLISSCYIDRIDFESRLTVPDFKSLLRWRLQYVNLNLDDWWEVLDLKNRIQHALDTVTASLPEVALPAKMTDVGAVAKCNREDIANLEDITFQIVQWRGLVRRQASLSWQVGSIVMAVYILWGIRRRTVGLLLMKNGKAIETLRYIASILPACCYWKRSQLPGAFQCDA